MMRPSNTLFQGAVSQWRLAPPLPAPDFVFNGNDYVALSYVGRESAPNKPLQPTNGDGAHEALHNVSYFAGTLSEARGALPQ